MLSSICQAAEENSIPQYSHGTETPGMASPSAASSVARGRLFKFHGLLA